MEFRTHRPDRTVFRRHYARQAFNAHIRQVPLTMSAVKVCDIYSSFRLTHVDQLNVQTIVNKSLHLPIVSRQMFVPADRHAHIRR